MTEIKKNDEFEIYIEDMSEEGEGIGKVEGYTLFVKDAVVGDRVRARVIKTKKSYGYARLMEVLAPSPDRVTPRCPAAAPCGGCQLQCLSYKRQLLFKEEKVRSQLKRIGGFADPPVLPVLGMENPYGYRNKAQLPFGRSRDGRIIAGFYAGRTHSIVETPRCYLGSPVNEEIRAAVIGWMEEFGIEPYDEKSHQGLVRHVLIRIGEAVRQEPKAQTEAKKQENPEEAPKAALEKESPRQLLVCLVINGRKLPHARELVQALLAIPGMTSISCNINTGRTNVILGGEMKRLYGAGYITDTIGDLRYRISPQSFYQVNPQQTRRLYETALSYAGLTGRETVWDLYCGTGTITLFLARQAREVRGVEIVPAAIEDARANAAANGIENASFYVGRAEEVLPRVYAKEGRKADVIVVDPPRRGCDGTLLQTILKIQPQRVVYVSCNPATLARDLKILCEEAYELVRVQPVDMFAQTVGVETVVMLSHKKPDSVINVKVVFGEGEGKVPLDNIVKRAEAYKPKERVTYKMIKEYIEAKYGFKVHTAYIAEVKRDLGLPMYDAPNAVEELKQPRKHPTAEKIEAIKNALKHFELI